MARWRVVRGAVDNALASLASRNADVDGWWLWGLVVRDLIACGRRERAVDLAARSDDALATVACDRLQRQLHAIGWSRLDVLRPQLLVRLGDADGLGRYGVDMSLVVTTHRGRRCEGKRTVSAWPHDRHRERRSGRAPR